jgi:hypothetical protein
MLSCTNYQMEDASQPTMVVNNSDLSDVMDTTNVKKLGETSLTWQLKMASCGPRTATIDGHTN